MPKSMIRNTAAGPRVFNLANGRQEVLMPGEQREMDLMVAIDADPIVTAWLDRGEIRVVTGKEAKEAVEPMVFDQKALAEAQERLRAAQGDVDRIMSAKQAAETDAVRRTPPRQLSTDGGPEQGPTVGLTPGAPTPNQGEGTAEQRRVAGEPNAAEAKATEQREQAAAEKGKGAHQPAPARR